MPGFIGFARSRSQILERFSLHCAASVIDPRGRRGVGVQVRERPSFRLVLGHVIGAQVVECETVSDDFFGQCLDHQLLPHRLKPGLGVRVARSIRENIEATFLSSRFQSRQQFSDVGRDFDLLDHLAALPAALLSPNFDSITNISH